MTMMLSTTALLCALFGFLCLVQLQSFLFSNRVASRPKPALVPVKQVAGKPVLVVQEPTTGSKVHLVGVSHGSAASSRLVHETIQGINPDVVVLELCDERYLSISLDARIRPQGNKTMEILYDKKLQYIQKVDEERASQKFGMFGPIKAYMNFIKAQGLLIGSFVSLGMMVSGLQRLSQAPSGDEFVTAMREAATSKRPIRMGDAPQTDTLNSVKQIISMDTIRPNEIIKGAKSLTFSAFGIPYEESLFKSIAQENKKMIDKSQWISIPKAYVQDTGLIKSLLPLFLVSIFTAIVGFIPGPMEQSSDPFSLLNIGAIGAQLSHSSAAPASFATAVAGGMATQTNFLTDFTSTVSSILNTELSPQAEFVYSTLVDISSLLLLIRLSKIIGYERDKIIASKVLDACREFPVSNCLFIISIRI